MTDTTTGNEPESGRIRRLDQRTVDRIAAGEVVERPASAVKELLENALDAGATRVSVAVDAGGSEGIRVTDNGSGMSEADARRAVEKHTTSKIDDIEDLEGGVSSLGFRGEALSALAAVSELSIRTKPRGESRGTELIVRGGDLESVAPVGCPAGTTIEVRDLFYNVPARKKYLKREATEFAHVNRIVTGYALASPGVALSLAHNDRETFATSGSGDLQEAVLATYGRAVAAAMIPIESEEEAPGDSNGPIETMSGLVSDPETTRASASYVTTIVNGRYVTARAIREAIVDAYGGQLAPDRYPFAVLRVDVPPEAIDVNVHPRKLEVRFEDETAITEAIETRIERTLLDNGLVRSGAPRGRSAPEQTRIDPPSETEEDLDERAATADPNAEGSESAPESESGAEPTVDGFERVEPSDSRTSGSTSEAEANRNRDPPTGRETESTASEGTESSGEAADPTGEFEADEPDPGAHTPVDRTPDDPSVESDPNPETNGTPVEPSVGSAGRTIDLEGTGEDPHAHIDERADRDPARRFAGGDQRSLSGGSPNTHREFERLPAMRVLGQFDETYAVAETADGVVLIDQHAADERVTYERLRERLPRGEAQTLATPVEIELTAGEAAAFEAATDTLATLGFYASWADSEGNANATAGSDGTENAGENTTDRRTVAVRTIPASIEGCDPGVLRDVLSAFVANDRPERTIDATADALLADMACYPSVTAGTSLSAGSMLELLEALDACSNPYACPHGRPVVIEFSKTEIEERFERDYPGHAGRRSE